MAVEVVFGDLLYVNRACRRGFVRIISHAGFHFMCYVYYDAFVSKAKSEAGLLASSLNVLWLQPVNFFNYGVIFHK